MACLAPTLAFAADDNLTTAQSDDLLAAQGEPGPEGVSMHRLYNPNSGEHFYTASETERDGLVEKGWSYEGVGWIAPTTSTDPVYRLYNEYGGEHHYTKSKSERDNLVSKGWNDEGIGWYSADASQPRVSLYRDYNPNAYANNHNYTMSFNEHQILVKAGWNFEGPAWCGLVSESTFAQGWICVSGNWRYYEDYAWVKGKWVVTADPPYVAGATVGLQRYWIDNNGKIAVNRLVEPSNALDSDAGYRAFATKYGYVVRGKYDDQAGHVYIANDDGKLYDAVGWKVTDEIDGRLERYYFDATTHAALSGSFTVGGKQYWGVAKEGYVARNTRLKVSGVWKRAAEEDGVLTDDVVVPKLLSKAQSYYSKTQYLIMVDIKDPCTVVFEGSKGAWSIKYVMDCCTGAPSTPTVVGEYEIGLKGYSFGEEKGYSCYYWTQFCGDYLFHSRKYKAYTKTLLDGSMGKRVSEGCVRLYDDDAIWIQDNVPEGTTVVTTY